MTLEIRRKNSGILKYSHVQFCRLEDLEINPEKANVFGKTGNSAKMAIWEHSKNCGFSRKNL